MFRLYAALLLFLSLTATHTVNIHAQGAEPEYQIIECSCQWLWSPESTDLEEWQILYDPRGITVSPLGDIVVADTRNTRVVRFSPEAELVEIIGRSGAGPGEFYEPVEVCFEPDSDILWVADCQNRRISRFQVSTDQSTLIDTFPCQQLMPLSNVVIRDQTSYFISPLRSENRISLFDSDGNIVRSYGNLFEPDRPQQPKALFNYGYIAVSHSNEIIFTGKFKPIFEKWSEEGELLYQCEFPFPEIDTSRRRDSHLPANSLHVFAEHVAYHYPNNRLYVMVRRNIYEVSLDTFKIERFFHINDLDSFPDSFAVQSSPDGIRFYLLNFRPGGVMVVSPSG